MSDKLVQPTQEEIKSFPDDIDNYISPLNQYEKKVIANNFVVNLKCFIESFNELIDIMVNNKKYNEKLRDISYKIDKGLRDRGLPTRVYNKDDYFDIVISTKVDVTE